VVVQFHFDLSITINAITLRYFAKTCKNDFAKQEHIMNFLTLAELAARLVGADLVAVAKATDLSYNTLKNIKEGRGAQWSTIEKLSTYFNAQA
jgi:hypothetical protein